MKSITLSLAFLLFSASVSAYAAEQIVPAGSLIECTMSEPQFSSKTASLGDPVLCQLGMTGLNGPSVFPYDSFLEGRFEAYKNPGHFVGKGWMELSFNRLFIEPNMVVPIQTKVVGVSGYNIDRQGRILGRGHAVRDTVEWMIPILWPIDLMTLPRRGPRPTLQPETQLTLKVMDDVGLPVGHLPRRDRSGLVRRPASRSQPVPQAAPSQPAGQSQSQPESRPASVAGSASPHQVDRADTYRPEYVVPSSPPPEYDYSVPPAYYVLTRAGYVCVPAGACRTQP